MGSSESIKEEYIKLPVDINGEPDWEYMERYVKQLYAREREFRPCYDLCRKIKIT